MLPIIFTLYFSVGAYALYSCLQMIGNESVQRKSKTVQGLLDMYEHYPTLTMVGLFIMLVVLWLPCALMALFAPRNEKEEINKEVEDIKDVD